MDGNGRQKWKGRWQETEKKKKEKIFNQLIYRKRKGKEREKKGGKSKKKKCSQTKWVKLPYLRFYGNTESNWPNRDPTKKQEGQVSYQLALYGTTVTTQPSSSLLLSSLRSPGSIRYLPVVCSKWCSTRRPVSRGSQTALFNSQ